MQAETMQIPPELHCSRGRRKTPNEYKAQLKGTGIWDRLRPIENYITNYTKIDHQCRKCGNIWQAEPTNILIGRGCPKCSGRHRYTPKEYAERVHEIHGNLVAPIEDYVNTGTPIQHQCNKGHTWSTAPTHILHLRTGCPTCNDTKKTHKMYCKELKRKGIWRHTRPIEKYIRTNTAIQHECQSCGKIHVVRPDTILLGRRCPSCNPRNYSRAAISCIRNIGQETGLKFQHAKRKGEHQIGSYFVDGYNRKHDITIEFHGTYWHSWHDKRRRAYRKTVDRDAFLAENTNLVVIWEHDWSDEKLQEVVDQIHEITRDCDVQTNCSA